jgi:hypothetical protein
MASTNDEILKLITRAHEQPVGTIGRVMAVGRVIASCYGPIASSLLKRPDFMAAMNRKVEQFSESLADEVVGRHIPALIALLKGFISRAGPRISAL